jgi:hypothetical protein
VTGFPVPHRLVAHAADRADWLLARAVAEVRWWPHDVPALATALRV